MVRKAIQLKKECFRDMSSRVIVEEVIRYRWDWRVVASATTEAKQLVWELFREAMEKDFQSAPRCFWKTFDTSGNHSRMGPTSKGGTLLTSTEEVIR